MPIEASAKSLLSAKEIRVIELLFGERTAHSVKYIQEKFPIRTARRRLGPIKTEELKETLNRMTDDHWLLRTSWGQYMNNPEITGVWVMINEIAKGTTRKA